MIKVKPEAPRGEGTQQRIVAVCGEIVFRNDLNGYTVADFDPQAPHSESFTAVGTMPFVDPGETVVLFGKWTSHPVYGRQLQVERCSPHQTTSPEDLIRYLSSGSIPWVGPKTARKIVDRFGADTLEILGDDPGRLSEIRGISAKKAQEISDVFRKKRDFQDLSLLLAPFGFGSTRIMSIYKRFGPSAPALLRKNPYLLVTEISGIGFMTADRLALSMGFDPVSPFRIGSAVLHLLTVFENEGDTYVALENLMRRTIQLLIEHTDREDSEEEKAWVPGPDSMPAPSDRSPGERSERIGFGADEFLRGMNYLTEAGKIVIYRTGKNKVLEFSRLENITSDLRVTVPEIFEAECSAARALVGRHYFSTKKGSADPKEENRISESIGKISSELSIELSDEQTRALIASILYPCSVITGGPGTGKTTIVGVLVRYFTDNGKKVVLCAPTGRAAKRLSDACDFPAGTIHRLLEVGHPDHSGTAVFGRNEDNPIEADVIIVDETSMLDTVLLDALLRALPRECGIVFIGDKDQLPSVSAGNVLSDMIASDKIPSSRLNTIYRQAKKSRIVLSAHSVLRGGEMVFDQSLESDCMLISKRSSEDISEAVKKLYSHVLPEVFRINSLREAIVLCPSRKGPAGISSLNPMLQEEYGIRSDRFIRAGGFSFRIGDRVMHTRNDYDLFFRLPDGGTGQGVFNGELGVVLSVDPLKGELEVELDDRRVIVYDPDHIENLEPAYAITVHKSQGSEFPVVILAIPGGPPMLYNRNLLYTAITRAREKLFVVSDRRTLAAMIRNLSQAERHTALREFMEIFAEGGSIE